LNFIARSSQKWSIYPINLMRLMYKLRSTLLIIIAFTAFNPNLIAQLQIYHSNEINVIKNGVSMRYPWAGGLNNPLFSSIDLDFDGTQDLFIYDRTNGKITTFLHNDQPNSINYSLDFAYENAFPELQNWAILRDYNCDGKVDIFSHRSSGIKVFENTSTANNPSFEPRNDFIEASISLGGDPFYTGIFVSSVDIPGIDDFDNDGDLDILTFTQGGSTVELYLNNSTENFGNCDSLDFFLANRCYGQFSESAMNEDIFLGEDATCDFNVIDPARSPERAGGRSGVHSGSSICIVDTDQNGYKDLILGDISATGLTLISLGASSTNLDSAFAAIPNYPLNTQTVETEFFPTGYYLDVNNDGIKDLMVSPAAKNEADDVECAYYYKNNGANDLLNPEFQQKDFLVDNMIDVGTGSFPHLVDYNQDGKMDLLVSNKGYYQWGGDYISQLALYENTGTETDPEFTFVDDDYLDFANSTFGRFLFPTFGDIDGDGDEDMILGNESGALYRFENTAGPGQTLAFGNGFQELLDEDGLLIDVGINAAPQLFDLNVDGLLDLVVGQRNGSIKYYQNIGNNNNPTYVLENDTLGNILTDLDGDFVGYGVPFAFMNNGNIEMLVGTQEGNVYHYGNIMENLDGEFDLISEHILNGNLYARPSPTVFDINGDDELDVFIGNFSGGIDLWMGGIGIGLSENTLNPDWIEIYPNPANESFQINSNELAGEKLYYQVIDPSGKLVAEARFVGGQTFTLACSDWSEGIYFIQISGERVLTTEKIIIRH